MAIPAEILERLRRNDPTIVGLSLSREVESDEDVVVLVKALKGNTHLRWLTIQGMWNQPGIGDRSAALLRSCHHLVYLDLSYNKNITNSGAAALALNISLETLFLRGCSVTQEGLKPFLHHDTVYDLRIAISAAPSEQVCPAVKAKLEENKEKWECKLLGQRLERLSINELNDMFYTFIREDSVSAYIQKLVSPIQSMAARDFRRAQDAITVGLIVSNNLSKLTGFVANKAAVYAQRYRLLREAQHEEFAEFQSEQRLERKRSSSPLPILSSEATERKKSKSQSLSPPSTPCSLSQSI